MSALSHLSRRKVERSLSLGYSFFKYEFLNVTAYIGPSVHVQHVPRADEGQAAYKHALDLIAEVIAGRAVVSYSFSLVLLVGPAGHSRWRGCDQMYGGVEYSMNQYSTLVAGG